MAEISVIMPVYNKEKYIEASLRSVLQQSFDDIEILVVDDGSTDRSSEIIDQFADRDPRIRVFHVRNGGVSSARNIGLEHAQGRWIQFLDADDMLEPDYLQNAVQVLEKEKADILFSAFTMVDTQGTSLRQISIPETGMRNQQELCDCFIRYQYSTGFFGYPSNKLFSRELLDISQAQFPVGTKLAEDLDFFARLYPFVDCAYFWNGKSYFYLQTETNYLHNPVIDYYSQLMIHVDIKRWFERSKLYEMYRAKLDERISQYAGFIFHSDNDLGKDLKMAYSFLHDNAEIMRCVNPKLTNGFTRLILSCLQKGNYRAITWLFALRNGLRWIYRKLR